MSYDWEDSVGVTPEYSVEYTCVRENKLLAPLADLDSGDEARIENLGWVHLKLFDCLVNKKKLFLIRAAHKLCRLKIGDFLIPSPHSFWLF